MTNASPNDWPDHCPHPLVPFCPLTLGEIELQSETAVDAGGYQRKRWTSDVSHTGQPAFPPGKQLVLFGHCFLPKNASPRRISHEFWSTVGRIIPRR
jgi:hypothetical protein